MSNRSVKLNSSRNAQRRSTCRRRCSERLGWWLEGRELCCPQPSHRCSCGGEHHHHQPLNRSTRRQHGRTNKAVPGLIINMKRIQRHPPNLFADAQRPMNSFTSAISSCSPESLDHHSRKNWNLCSTVIFRHTAVSLIATLRGPSPRISDPRVPSPSSILNAQLSEVSAALTTPQGREYKANLLTLQSGRCQLVARMRSSSLGKAKANRR